MKWVLSVIQKGEKHIKLLGESVSLSPLVVFTAEAPQALQQQRFHSQPSELPCKEQGGVTVPYSGVS